MLKESHLIALILKGVDNVYLDVSHCEECSFRYGKRNVEKTLSYARNLLGAIGYYDRIRTEGNGDSPTLSMVEGVKIKVKEIAASHEYSRREIFFFLRDKAIENISGNSIKKGSDNKIDEIPERRLLLLEAFKNWDVFTKGGKGGIKEGEFPIHQINIRSDCTMCYKCESFCPTGAIKRIEDDREVRIDFQMALCMGCYQCKELCPEGAIYYGEDIDLKQLAGNEIKTVIRRVKIECPVCGHSFIPEDNAEGCPTCRKKMDLDKRVLKCIGSGYAVRS